MNIQPPLTNVERHFVAYAAEHTGTWWTRWAYVRAWVGAGLFVALLATMLVMQRAHPVLELGILAGMLLVIEGMFTFLMQLCGKLWRAGAGERHEGTEARRHEAEAKTETETRAEGQTDSEGGPDEDRADEGDCRST